LARAATLLEGNGVLFKRQAMTAREGAAALESAQGVFSSGDLPRIAEAIRSAGEKLSRAEPITSEGISELKAIGMRLVGVGDALKAARLVDAGERMLEMGVELRSVHPGID
jgi:hypothetical protein